MKTKLWNQLTMHLELVIQMFGQKFFTLQNIFLRVVTQNWKNIEICYGVVEFRLW
jgi:hypothetical protein